MLKTILIIVAIGLSAMNAVGQSSEFKREVSEVPR